ncbi:hypothetical protein G7047_28600 [Diaphorobacter sp. HDW4A]|uniref:hypothetical protein n=1 Tax=Diaphorobacter sp. HDW4A TaxID=2714924 RepID=UPI00140D4AC2|nr:hypothetical protein [Diaphorobacter sp. HDW4A]QIL83465.1 hypothetical protein G7047_28600 [Diaphorobacter sp. HDW4A]
MLRKLAVVQLLCIVAVAAVWFLAKTQALLATPPPPHSDLHAHEWGFQLVVFAVFWLPIAMVGATALVGVEYFVLRTYQAWRTQRFKSE